jgi:serine/threonine protein kinase/TolB-like protein
MRVPPSTSTGAPSPGEIVAGKYRVDRVLATGGMGVVVVATHLPLQEQVALKLLHPRARFSPSAYGRFVQEARLASRIRSEHVVRVFDLGTLASGRPYIAMELLDGADLATLVARDGPLPVERATDCVVEACEGVAAAHARGIVHRDLKPANLFLARASDGSPSVKVLDFGISKMLGAGPLEDAARGAPPATPAWTHGPLGSPQYMSPEQVRCSERIDARTDIWSLGTILYELLAGARAFDAETPEAIDARITDGEPRSLRELRPEIPPGLEEVVRRCLQKDASARFEDVGQLATALAPYASAAGAATAERAPRTLRHRGAETRAPEPTFRAATPLDTEVTVSHEVSRAPSRARRFAAITAVAMAVAAAAAGAVALRPPPPAQVSRASAGHRIRRAIAIDVRDVTGRREVSWLAGGLTDLMSAELRAGDALRVAAGGDGLSREDEGGAASEPATARIARRLGVDAVLGGSCAASGDEIRVDLALSDAAGAVFARITDHGPTTDPFAVAARVARRVREELGIAQATPEQAAASRAAMPASADSARAYVTGLDLARRYDYPAARAAFEQAIAADGAFAPAHAHLAQVLAALGFGDAARAEARRGFEMSAPLPRAEQLLIEARLHKSEKDYRAAANSMRVLFGFYPDEVDYGVDLASDLTFADDPRAAFDVIAALHGLPPPLGDDPRIDLQESLASQVAGDHVRELAAARRAVEESRRRGEHATEAEASFYLASGLMAERQLDAARVAADEARAVYEALGDRDGYGMATTTLSTIALAAADYPRAEAEETRALAIFDEIGDRLHAGWGRHNLGNVRASAGDLDGALRAFDEARAIFRVDGDQRGIDAVLVDSAAALARGGRDAEALARVDEAAPSVARSQWDEAQRNVELVRARVHLHRGELADAQRGAEGAALSAQRAGDVPIEAEAGGLLAEVLRERDDSDGARSALDHALELWRGTGAGDAADDAEIGLAELRADVGDAAGAVAALAAIAERAARAGRRVATARAGVALAAASLAAGDLAGADEARRAAATNPVASSDYVVGVRAKLVEAEVDAARTPRAAGVALESLRADARAHGNVGIALATELALAEATGPASRAAKLEAFALRARSLGYARLARLADEARRRPHG